MSKPAARSLAKSMACPQLVAEIDAEPSRRSETSILAWQIAGGGVGGAHDLSQSAFDTQVSFDGSQTTHWPGGGGDWPVSIGWP